MQSCGSNSTTNIVIVMCIGIHVCTKIIETVVHLFINFHLHSINKQNSEFTPNTDETICQGHKWGLLALWRYMRSQLGINTDKVWDSIKDLVVKTIISSESFVSSNVKAFVKNRCVYVRVRTCTCM